MGPPPPPPPPPRQGLHVVEVHTKYKMQQATIVTTPSNELGMSVRRSAPSLVVRTPTVEGKYSCMSTEKTPGSDRETTPGASTARVRLTFALKVRRVCHRT